ncbi:MAG TPA: methyltransferase domain-containing protein [Thermoanaerobaculia bacterium]|nr:methyltransferase domain-containing protein [Thermoanaerobaculia bacterium]
MSEDYVLGTHDEEIARLGLQHRVWRRRALDAWLEAGFTAGQTLLDVGCGPGYATADLAEIGERVVAIDRSTRFLDVLRSRQLRNVSVFELDLDDDAFPSLQADGAWARWVFSFVTKPWNLLRRVRGAMKRGGTFVVQEYFDYRTWRMTPRAEHFEGFVDAVMASWRAEGGEPDIALDLLRWFPDEGFRVKRVRPIVEIITPEHFIWQWPRSFINTGVDRLVQLGRLSAEDAQSIKAQFAERESDPTTRMVTPAVLEIIAEAI